MVFSYAGGNILRNVSNNNNNNKNKNNNNNSSNNKNIHVFNGCSFIYLIIINQCIYLIIYNIYLYIIDCVYIYIHILYK